MQGCFPVPGGGIKSTPIEGKPSFVHSGAVLYKAMSEPKELGCSGRDHYRDIYRDALAVEAAWLRFGAADKADSIQLLLEQQQIRPKALVELGCGTGAVIGECQRRGIAAEYVAVDFSEEAIGYLSCHLPAIQAIACDIMDPQFSLSLDLDVIVLSHVLEHLEDPEKFLRNVTRNLRFSYMVAEVPLEDLPGSRVKNLFRDRTRNRAGHVQFFTRERFEALLTASGLHVISTRRYVPIMSSEGVRHLCRKDGLSQVRMALRNLTGRYLPKYLGPVWQRWYYSNLAVLCRPEPT